MESQRSSSRAERPVLRHSSLTGGSFIKYHQQYKPAVSTPPVTQNISDVLQTVKEDGSPLPLRTNPISPDPEKVTDSGIVHSIYPVSPNPLPAGTPKLVATIFYNPSRPVQPNGSSNGSSSTGNSQSQSVPAGSAPSADVEKLPREPLEPDPEPLDHLYGQFVSQLCVASFLQMLEGLQTPFQRMNTSHRCLDQEEQPRVVEVTASPLPNPEYLSFADLRKHESVWRFEREWNVEVVLQKESVFRRHKRLAVFDMDSTLIQNEVIDEIAKFVGVEKEVSVRLFPCATSANANAWAANHRAGHERGIGFFCIAQGSSQLAEGCSSRRLRQTQVRHYHLTRCQRIVPSSQGTRIQIGRPERRIPAARRVAC